MDQKVLSCHYGRCWLPKNNYKYLWQVCLLAVSVAVLMKEAGSFSFFSIFLFVSPIMVDILTIELEGTTCTVFRWIFGVVNVVLLVFCVLGFADVIVDNGSYFAFVSTFMVLKGFSVKKAHMGIVLVLDILVPFVFLLGAPSQKKLNMLDIYNMVSEMKGANVK